jgi:hypothetical protein
MLVGLLEMQCVRVVPMASDAFAQPREKSKQQYAKK